MDSKSADTKAETLSTLQIGNDICGQCTGSAGYEEGTCEDDCGVPFGTCDSSGCIFCDGDNPAEVFVDIGDGEWSEAEDISDDNGNGIWDDAEEYIDNNLNGIYDCDDELKVDFDGDGEWDDAEGFIDANDNGVWDDAEKFTDANDNHMALAAYRASISPSKYWP